MELDPDPFGLGRRPARRDARRVLIDSDRLGAGPGEGQGVHLGSDAELDDSFGRHVATEPQFAVVGDVGAVGQMERHHVSVPQLCRCVAHHGRSAPRALPLAQGR